VRDREKNYTYNAAVVVDDLRDGVNLIIRGQDLLHATGRQLQLRQLLGSRAVVHYYHHPLLYDGQMKLSKRDGSLGIRHLREQGHNPGDVWALAAKGVGLPQFAGV